MTVLDDVRPRSFSRRSALLATLASAPFGCRRSSARIAAPAEAAGAPSSPSSSAPWGGLGVVRVSSMREGERGGTAVIVLHGWGAPGADLVPIAEELKRPGVRFFVPAAPLPEVGGGRAWWHLDPHTRPPHAATDRVAPDFRPSPPVVAARTAVQALIATVVDRYAPETVALLGFSQGAMLSIDVALAAKPAVARVVAMSGVLLVDSVPALIAPHAVKPRFLLSHGRQDPVVPFASGTRAKELLEAHAFPVTWRPFDGGHEIPPPVLAEAERFLFP
jgi:phospholipase/carboxylesterase